MHNTQSRIDRIYGTLNFALTATTTTKPVLGSDHKLLYTKFSIDIRAMDRGKSYWKLNTLLLGEEGVYTFTRLRLITLSTNPTNENWENFKSYMSDYFKNLGKTKAKERALERKSLENRIKNIEELLQKYRRNEHLLKSLKFSKNELEKLNQFYVAKCRHNTYYRDFVDDKLSFASAKSNTKAGSRGPSHV